MGYVKEHGRRKTVEIFQILCERKTKVFFSDLISMVFGRGSDHRVNELILVVKYL